MKAEAALNTLHRISEGSTVKNPYFKALLVNFSYYASPEKLISSGFWKGVQDSVGLAAVN